MCALNCHLIILSLRSLGYEINAMLTLQVCCEDENDMLGKKHDSKSIMQRQCVLTALSSGRWDFPLLWCGHLPGQ